MQGSTVLHPLGRSLNHPAIRAFLKHLDIEGLITTCFLYRELLDNRLGNNKYNCMVRSPVYSCFVVSYIITMNDWLLQVTSAKSLTSVLHLGGIANV